MFKIKPIKFNLETNLIQKIPSVIHNQTILLLLKIQIANFPSLKQSNPTKESKTSIKFLKNNLNKIAHWLGDKFHTPNLSLVLLESPLWIVKRGTKSIIQISFKNERKESPKRSKKGVKVGNVREKELRVTVTARVQRIGIPLKVKTNYQPSVWTPTLLPLLPNSAISIITLRKGLTMRKLLDDWKLMKTPKERKRYISYVTCRSWGKLVRKEPK